MVRSIVKFCIDFFLACWIGSPRYYAWLAFLGFFIALMAIGSIEQAFKGLIVTGLSDQISDGLYLSNFVFLVGVAAAAVTVVFPAYIYNRKDMKDVVVLGEMLAISAVSMCMLFILLHMGRPDRLWHMIPGWVPLPYLHGIFNWPNSVLNSDVIVLNGYLFLNFVCAFYYLYQKYMGKEVNKYFYMPLVYIAIVWALSIHTVTAFLLNTLAARSMWHHSVLPIKFISTAFAAGPALIIVAFTVIKKSTDFKIPDSVFNLLSQIVVWCLGIALFLMLSEIVTELYSPTEHANGLIYLMLGKHGLTRLVPWFWASFVLMWGSFILLLIPKVRKNLNILPIICLAAFFGIWIEKGMGLLLPGYIPTPVGEFTEYYPTLLEVICTIGVWAFGLMMFSMLLKASVAIKTGKMRYEEPAFEEPKKEQYFDPDLKLNRTMGKKE
ncbi:MAG: polysulfide reductase NrfD [Deltaproteobacteria bacterium]|nr:polysulfide reductase NrfD [Deltaproteobacteria bacterium]